MIYHLLLRRDWEKALDKEVYKPDSLKTEGFIHFSTKEQVLESAGLYFAEAQELLAVEVVEKRIDLHLKWEPGRRGELFPHLYAPLNFESVENLHLIRKNSAGAWEWV